MTTGRDLRRLSEYVLMVDSQVDFAAVLEALLSLLALLQRIIALVQALAGA